MRIHKLKSLNSKDKISLKLKLAEKSWLFSIGASFVGLFSLLTPILYINMEYYAKRTCRSYIQEWISGYYKEKFFMIPGPSFSFESFIPLPIHIIATTLIVTSHFAILVIAAKKLKKKEQFVSPYLIYFSILAMITVVGYVIYFWTHLVEICAGSCLWERYIFPGFAVYGQFISGFLVNINYYLGKTKR